MLTKEQLEELRRNAENVQTVTWMTHAAGVAILPGLIAMFLPGPQMLWAALLATAGACYFGLVREPMDKLKHLLAENYDTPDSQGITPRIDKWGDTLGPVVAAVTYWMALLVSL